MDIEAAVKAFNEANLSKLIPFDSDTDDGFPNDLYRAGTDFFVTFTVQYEDDEDETYVIFKVDESGVSVVPELPVSVELVDGEPFAA